MLDLQIYLGYPLWLRRRVIRAALTELTEYRFAPEKQVIDRIDAAAQKLNGSLSAGGGVQVEIARQQIILRGPHRSVHPAVIEVSNRWIPVEGLGLSFRARETRFRGGTTPRKKRSPRVTLDRAKIVPPLVVRPIRPGDRFAPLGMSGQKKVGDYLTDRKVPVARRDEIPVMCDDKGIVWLVGWEIADRVKIDPTTTEVVAIEYRNVKTTKSKTV